MGSTLSVTTKSRNRQERKVVEVRTFYSNGYIKQAETYVDGRREGEQFYYHDNDRTRLIKTYKRGKLHGTQVEYHRDGTLKAQSYYLNGKKTG